MHHRRTHDSFHTAMKPRFSLRDLAWAAVVFALIHGWLYDRTVLTRLNRFTVKTYRQGEPVVLRDTATGHVLIKREGDIWWVANDRGQSRRGVKNLCGNCQIRPIRYDGSL